MATITDPCGICGKSWSGNWNRTDECVGHVWTSVAYLDRQEAAHYGKPCDLGRVVLHSRDCPVCTGLRQERAS